MNRAESILKEIKIEKARVKAGEEYSKLNIKEKELKTEIKEVQESLNTHLVNYSRITGVNFMDDEEGYPVHFGVRAKLKSGQLTLL